MTKSSTLWTRDILDPYRSETDPLADDVVKNIFDDGVMAIDQLFHRLTRNRDIDHNILPPVVQQYFQSQKQFPDWVDWDKIRMAEELYDLFCPEISMLLFYKSLPATYSCWRGASVLVTTGRMVEHHHSVKMFTTRLMETSQFVMDVMKPGGFSEDGNAIEKILKVRLIHAAIRHFINKGGDWDYDELGQPINHQDMTGTLLSFSSFIIEGLVENGFRISRHERDAIYHLWRLTGHFMGLPEKLMVETYEESLDLGHAILDQQQGHSEPGIILTKALIDFVNEVVEVKWLKNSFARTCIIYFAGKKTARYIGVSKPNYFMLAFLWFFQRTYALVLHLFSRNMDSKIVQFFSRFNRRLLSRLIRKFNHNKQVYFDVPPSLTGTMHPN